MVNENNELKKSMNFEDFILKIQRKKGILGLSVEDPKIKMVNN